jgi:hypothetical protein
MIRAFLCPIGIKTRHYDNFLSALCKIMQDFAVSVREHVKNTGTKPVQPCPRSREFLSSYKRKNPDAAATANGAQFRKAHRLSLNIVPPSPFKANLVAAT